ncbi:MAG: hypothetical protein KGK07_08465 [Chloroflexota bacterium]|nr:hypothetical protein [Chloroflexota bacterium]
MIPGYFHPHSSWPVPFVRASLWLPGIQEQWTPVEILIDTGAGRTALHPLDAVTKVGIPIQTLVDPTAWTRHETPAGIGGKALYFVVAAHYAFLKSDGQWHQMDGEIRIAQATMSNVTLPSLLGCDLLQHLPLTTDWVNRTILLG